MKGRGRQGAPQTGWHGSRRAFLSTAAATTAGVWMADSRVAAAQAGTPAPMTRFVETSALRIGYEESGNANGIPVVLLHGFPDDVRAFDGVIPPLVRAGHRVLVPYLRGHGATRFRAAGAPRMAQQAAIGQDVIDFADALRLPRFAVAGYDWGGRAAAIAAALVPDRVRAAVLIGGYTVQDTVTPAQPGPPEGEYRQWYQWYFNTERGRAGLAANRRPLCRLLWQLWSPSWRFTDAEYDRTAVSFDNPDFVDVVIHSYRHRHMNAPGEARFQSVEVQLARQPPIKAAAITLYGSEDGIRTPSRESPPEERAALPGLVARRVVDGVGHFMPRERPDIVSTALLELLARTG
jgi:pimeloyl-ACP methyl ester carboxylesterase